MGISESASVVSIPEVERPYPSLLTFFEKRFPHIPQQTWRDRIIAGKVFTEDGIPITLETCYMPDTRLFYYREVEKELTIPFHEEIIYSSDHLMVVCKPHFLPVTPSGPYVSESLINRLKKTTGNPFLSPINRIDRGTAGLVLVSTQKDTRGLYQSMFMEDRVKKSYEAITYCPAASDRSGQTEWMVENRLEPGDPWFRMKTCAGSVNARSRIRLVEVLKDRARFELNPITGKKHQLRVHLSGLGFPIVGDRCYPRLLPEKTEDYSAPLLLLARRIEFRDPVSGEQMVFISRRNL